MERVVLNALAKQMRLCRLTFGARNTVERHLAPLAIGFGIVFGEADPPFAKRAKVERVVPTGGTRCPQRVGKANAALPPDFLVRAMLWERESCALGGRFWHRLRRSRSTFR